MNTGTIYLIKNTVNSKIYIGQTIRPLNERLMGHFYESRQSRSNSLLHKAIQKYGIESFIIIPIRKFVPVNQLAVWEIFYIELYCANNKKWAHFSNYNLANGGAGFTSQESKAAQKIRWAKQENIDKARNQMSVVSNKNWADKDYSEKMKSVLAKNRQNKTWWTNYNKYVETHRENISSRAKKQMIEQWKDTEYKKRMTEISRKRTTALWSDPEFRQNRMQKIGFRLTQLDKDGIIIATFDSVRAASRMLQIPSGRLYRAIENGKQLQGYFWKATKPTATP